VIVLQNLLSMSTKQAADQGEIFSCTGKAHQQGLVSPFFANDPSITFVDLYIALHEPFVLAFEPTFIEIRHIETGHMSQVIQGSNLRLLFADNPPSVTNVTNPYQPR
jgi:hypothetical protein